jgi:hypothetical protein
MTIFGTRRQQTQENNAFASSTDFCRIFEKDMDRLYVLSLLLTGDPELAEKCFVRGLEDSKNGNPVFKEWAESWARRTIINNAIREIRPRPYGQPSAHDVERVGNIPSELAAIIDLPAFKRFVFVMSVLEGYSNRDCRLLLEVSNFDVAEARACALQRLGTSNQEQDKVVSILRLKSHAGCSESLLSPETMERLAASA